MTRKCRSRGNWHAASLERQLDSERRRFRQACSAAPTAQAGELAVVAAAVGRVAVVVVEQVEVASVAVVQVEAVASVAWPALASSSCPASSAAPLVQLQRPPEERLEQQWQAVRVGWRLRRSSSPRPLRSLPPAPA